VQLITRSIFMLLTLTPTPRHVQITTKCSDKGCKHRVGAVRKCYKCDADVCIFHATSTVLDVTAYCDNRLGLFYNARGVKR
jgi:hypothetical protein